MGKCWVSERWLAKEDARVKRGSAVEVPFKEFCGDCRIKTKSHGIIKFRHDIWHEEQKRFERDRTGRDIVLKGRQIGFTTLELMRGLYMSATRSSWNTVVAGHDQKLVQDLFDHIRFAAVGLEVAGKLPETSQDTVRNLRFESLASAISVTEAGATTRSASKKGHSGTIQRLHATEVARWAEPGESMKGFLGAVPDDGEVVLESVAAGAGGYFHNRVLEAQRGESRYKLHFYPWFIHEPYRAAVLEGFDPEPKDEHEVALRGHGCTDEQIVWWRGKVGDHGLSDALEQYPYSVSVCFRFSGKAWIEPSHIDRLARDTREPIREAPILWKARRFANLLVFAEPKPGAQYVVFADPAEGVANDGSAACVMDARTTEVVATWWSDSTDPTDFGIVLGVIGWMFNTALVGVERNNHGHAVIGALKSPDVVRYPRLYVAPDMKIGYDTNLVTRPPLWEDLAHAIREGSASTPDSATVAECQTIIRDKDGKPRARGKSAKTADACRDDRYVAWAGCWQIRPAALQQSGGMHVSGL